MKKLPNKRIAREKMALAIQKGELKRLCCEKCGEVKSEGHHNDYSKPLMVTWLCKKHHNEWHKNNKTPIGYVDDFIIRISKKSYEKLRLASYKQNKSMCKIIKEIVDESE